MVTLREIDQDTQALEDLLLELGGEVTDEQAEQAIDQWLAENKNALEKKIDGYATVIREAENRQKEKQDEANRLLALAAVDANIVKRLKDRLRWFMDEKKIDKIDGKYHKVTLARNGGVQAITLLVDVEKLPSDYQRVKVEADMDALRAALGNPDLAISYARLEPRGKHVRIR